MNLQEGVQTHSSAHRRKDRRLASLLEKNKGTEKAIHTLFSEKKALALSTL